MEANTLAISKQQLDLLFPFYILVNPDFIIEDVGRGLENVLYNIKGRSFITVFGLYDQNMSRNDFNSLKEISGHVITLEIEAKLLLLKGRFEHFETSGQFLFLGSEYIQSENHLLNPQQQSQQQIYDIALFPMQSPDPLLRVRSQGIITMMNPAAEELLEFHYKGITYATEDFWKFIARRGYYIFHKWSFDVVANGKTYCFVCKYFAEKDYFNVYGKDVTQQRQNEAELHRLSLLASTNESGVIYNDDQGIIFWVNDAFCRMLGYEAADIIGRKTLDFCEGPLTENITLKNIASSIGKSESFNTELIHYRKDGSWFWGRVKGKSFRTSEKDTLQYFAVVEDITLEKQKEERLELLSLIAEKNINAVIITDKRGRITWVNKSFSEMTGYSLKEVEGKKPGKLLQGPDTDHQAIEYLRTHVANGEPFNIEIYNYTKSGSGYWLSIKGQPFFSSNGELIGFFATEEDITYKKAIEDKLKTNEEKYRNIITNMNLGLLEVDNDEKITYANKGFCDMTGYSFAELVGEDAKTLLTNAEGEQLLKEKSEIRKLGIADAYELQTKHKKGESKWWLISGAPRYNDSGNLVGSIGIYLDITEHKKLELQLIEASAKAEQMARTKEIFLANMSHEIRTPMNAILGMSSQLAKTKLAPQQQYFLDIVLSASENLLVIINDILDLSKIEAGKLGLEKIGFQPKALVTKAIRVLSQKAEEKGLQLKNSFFDSNIAHVLLGDPHRLNQVLLNLLGNAIKFTETGSVDLLFKLIEDKPGSQVIQLDVKDTGIGMEEVFTDHLFEKFTQEYESVARNYGGTGLGMSICKDLVELMNGSIWVESKKGLGTTISFKIELNKGNFTDLPVKSTFDADPDFLSGRKVLVADDNEMNRAVASTFLKNYGAEIIEASDGLQVVEAFSKFGPDIILMDIQMPGLNGFEATNIIRETNQAIPIIALTANAIKGENEKCIVAGMNDYLSKPFSEYELLNKIAHLLGAKITVKKKTQIQASINITDLYSLASVREISQGNEAFVAKMVSLFCEQTPAMLAEMTTAYYN
jgi:PAS domain S-box-containing protein